jgi:hypothetical protein
MPTRSERREGRASLMQHKTNTSPGIGEDQHADNTNKTAFTGTRRHDCENEQVGPLTFIDAGELG